AGIERQPAVVEDAPGRVDARGPERWDVGDQVDPAEGPEGAREGFPDGLGRAGAQHPDGSGPPPRGRPPAGPCPGGDPAPPPRPSAPPSRPTSAAEGPRGTTPAPGSQRTPGHSRSSRSTASRTSPKDRS